MRVSSPAPLRLLVGSFLAMIAVGAGLLMLPVSTPPGHPIGPVDALFTATSATCVTGLVVRDTGTEFTIFGQVVILALIQLGGLGIMTFSLLLFTLFRGRFSLVSRSLVTQTLAAVGHWEEIWGLLRMVGRFTLAVESIGALLLFVRWQPDMGWQRAAYAAVFHSISAFCNAGFGLWADSLTAYRNDVLVNVVVSGLVILGGLGFLVVYELLGSRFRRRSLSIHTRITLVTTAVLLFAGTAVFAILERHDTLAGMGVAERVLASFFQSMSCRTAGFNTLDIGSLAPATLFLMIGLMFIGGSPGSCAGGIKTTTFAVLVLTAWNRFRRRTNVNVFYRTLSPANIANTLSITLSGFAVVMVGLFFLLLLEAPHAAVVNRHDVFVGYLFETVSALGTVGLSTGLTAMLTPASRVLITLLMFLGRLGPLTVAASLARESPETDWQYPEEEVMVG